MLKDIILPELSATTRIVAPFSAFVAEAEATSFDVILGQDFNISLGTDVINSQRVMRWNDNEAPFRVVPAISNRFRAMQQACIDSLDTDNTYPEECHAAELLESKYEHYTMDEILEFADNQSHLEPQKRKDLRVLFSNFSQLFDNELRVYPGKKIHLELKEGSRPVYRRPYPVARAHEELFKKELDRLEQIGVLKKIGASEWGLPSFAIPKKDNRIRFISDLRELNKVIKRKVYPLPRIADVLRRRNGYKYFTKLDISMMFYTFELDDESKKVCTITTPFGNYEYQRLPMGCCQSPDVAQEIMESVLADIPEIEVFIDDVGIFTKTWEDHLRVLDVVLSRLQNNNFIINPLKCEWAVEETDFLGHWITPTGLRPWRKKVDAILKLDRPRNITDVRSFIGAVNFYRDMYPKRSHIMAPLHELTGAKAFRWEAKHQEAFDAMKAVMTRDAYLRYPDHNKEFHVYTDASDLQLGSVIMQDNKPVAFYSRKLNPAQRNYTTMEKELLSIVETFKEFRTMLYGCKALHAHTDHKNLTYANLNSQRVMRWRLFIEEFNPQFHYIEGKSNTLADALSRLPRKPEEQTGATSSVSNPMIFDEELSECLLNFPEVSNDKPFVLDYGHISEEQKNDATIQQLMAAKPNEFYKQSLGKEQAIVVRWIESEDRPHICIPDSMLVTMIDFYHQVLGHPGITRLVGSMQQHFYHPRLLETATERVKNCDACQHCKLTRNEYGELPERQAHAIPWSDLAVDSIGPWTIRDKHGFDHEFNALTIIDMVTNYVEIIRLHNKTADHVARQFKNQWLSRYPRPNTVIFDPGTEFKGAFRDMLRDANIEPAPTTVKNPQANSICERLHQTVAEVIRTIIFEEPPEHSGEAGQVVDDALAMAGYAARTALHSTLGLSPGALVFNRDMLLDIPVIADWEALSAKRQHIIAKNLKAANRKRISHDYATGDKILKLAYKPNKLQPRAEGPYEIVRVHCNGTVTIQLTPMVTERLNIRRIKPYWERK
jgi:transposase InsO family protein